MRIKVKTVLIKKIRKARLPLKPGEELDLDVAYSELKNVFDVRYDPTVTRFHGMHIVIGRVSYLIFKNGTVMIAGNLSLSEEEKILNLLWRQHLSLLV